MENVSFQDGHFFLTWQNDRRSRYVVKHNTSYNNAKTRNFSHKYPSDSYNKLIEMN